MYEKRPDTVDAVQFWRWTETNECIFYGSKTPQWLSHALESRHGDYGYTGYSILPIFDGSIVLYNKDTNQTIEPDDWLVYDDGEIKVYDQEEFAKKFKKVS